MQRFPRWPGQRQDLPEETVSPITAVEVVPGDEERGLLEAQFRKHGAPGSPSDRCRIILPCAGGLRKREIAGRIGVHGHTAGKWRRRFAGKRIPGLPDEYRSGRPRMAADDKVAEVVERTPDTMPKDATHRWSGAWPVHGRVAHDDAPDPVGIRPEAAPERDVQAAGGAAIRRRGQDIAGACMAPTDRAGAGSRGSGCRAENPRPCPPRHDDALRRARRRRRRGDRQVLRAPWRHGVPGLPRGERGGPPAPACPLHAGLGVMDRPGPALVRGTGREEAAAGHASSGRGAGRGHHVLHRRAGREAEALQAGQVRRRGPCVRWEVPSQGEQARRERRGLMRT